MSLLSKVGCREGTAKVPASQDTPGTALIPTFFPPPFGNSFFTMRIASSKRKTLLHLSLLSSAWAQSGCWKSWHCTGSSSGSAYYCDGVGVTPCSFAYYGCDTAEYSESCTPVLGEVSGGTCADMVGPWGADYAAGQYYCDADACGAEYCAEQEAQQVRERGKCSRRLRADRGLSCS